MLRSKSEDVDNMENVSVEHTDNKSKIIPGKKVKIVGTNVDVKGREIPENPEFGYSISQILANGNISVLAGEGIILELKPENIVNVK